MFLAGLSAPTLDCRHLGLQHRACVSLPSEESKCPDAEQQVFSRVWLNKLLPDESSSVHPSIHTHGALGLCPSEQEVLAGGLNPIPLGEFEVCIWRNPLLRSLVGFGTSDLPVADRDPALP